MYTFFRHIFSILPLSFKITFLKSFYYISAELPMGKLQYSIHSARRFFWSKGLLIFSFFCFFFFPGVEVLSLV